MSNFIKGVKVGDEVKQYDYDALGNKPTLLTVDTTLTESGKAADAKAVGKAIASCATAIKGYANGKTINVDDVSSSEHVIRTRVSSKNILPFTTKTATYNGSTYTIGTDGSITISTTPTSGFELTIGRWDIAMPLHGIYTISVGTALPKGSYFFIKNTNGEKERLVTYYTDGSTTKTFSLDGDYIEFGMWVSVDGVFSNHKFYPQLELGNTATNYSPHVDPSTTTLTYGGNAYVPDANGRIEGLISTYPVMEMSVPDGFIICVEYNRDSTTVIEKLVNAIKALGGTV